MFEPDKVKQTSWYYGYQTRVKGAVLIECQSFDGVLQIVSGKVNDLQLIDSIAL